MGPLCSLLMNKDAWACVPRLSNGQPDSSVSEFTCCVAKGSVCERARVCVEIAGTEGQVAHSGVRVCGKLQSLTWLLSSHRSPSPSQIPARRPRTARGWREPIMEPVMEDVRR